MPIVRSTATKRIHEPRRHNPHRLTWACADLPTWARATARVGGDDGPKWARQRIVSETNTAFTAKHDGDVLADDLSGGDEMPERDC